MDDRHELKFSRIVTVAVSLFALIVALFFTSAYDALMFAWTFYAASMGLPCLAALFWKKATSPGIIASMLAGFVSCVGWKLLGEPMNLGSTIVGVVCCGVVLVCVSLATCKNQPSRQV